MRKTDLFPVEYLEQRIKYFKKQKKTGERFKKDKRMLEKYTIEQLDAGLNKIDALINLYTVSVKILKSFSGDRYK